MVASIVSSWVGLFCSLRVFTESLVHKESLISFPLGIPKPGSNAASVGSAGSALEEGLGLDSARGDHGTCGPFPGLCLLTCKMAKQWDQPRRMA